MIVNEIKDYRNIEPETRKKNKRKSFHVERWMFCRRVNLNRLLKRQQYFFHTHAFLMNVVNRDGVFFLQQQTNFSVGSHRVISCDMLLLGFFFFGRRLHRPPSIYFKIHEIFFIFFFRSYLHTYLIRSQIFDRTSKLYIASSRHCDILDDICEFRILG